MKEAIEKSGGQLIEAHISNSSEVMQAAQSLVGRVDAIHVTSDNTAVSAFESIVKVCNDNRIPLFVGDRDSVPRGAIASYGLDYFMVGYTAGKKAARILKGENPADIPAGLAEGYSLWINLLHAKNQGAKLPMVLVEKAADKIWDEKGNVVKGK
jgi:putative ABC transport system substrate-binding protein